MPVSPAAGTQPATNVSQKPASSGKSGFIKIPVEPLFSGIGHVLFLAAVVAVIGVLIFFVGISSFQKSISNRSSQKIGPLAPPINVADVKFPGDLQRDLFLKKLHDAAKATDYTARYKLLLDNYSTLLGFYSGDHDPKTRAVLEQYAQYMINNYPEHAQESIYTVPCFDASCGKASYPAEIKKIKDEVDNGAFDKSLIQNLDRSFEAAALSSDKNFQWSMYINALSGVKSLYDKNKDANVLSLYKELLSFIEKNYPNYIMPPQIKL